MNPNNAPHYKLWHLIPLDQDYKLTTFLASGLWCAQLNSIVSFADDVEPTQPYGVFVSCWHRSEGDPTQKAWEIFGASGNGIALRAYPETLQSLARQHDLHWLRASVADVRYLEKGEKASNPAFEVFSSHQQEHEVRFALSTMSGPERETTAKQVILENVSKRVSYQEWPSQIEGLTFVDRDGDDDAIVVPIAPTQLIEEIVLGTKVGDIARRKLIDMFSRSGLSARIRQ